MTADARRPARRRSPAHARRRGPVERVLLLRLRPRRRLDGRLAPARALSEPRGGLVDDLDRAARPSRCLLGRLPSPGPARRRPGLGVQPPLSSRSASDGTADGEPDRDRPPPPARGVPPGRAARRPTSSTRPRTSTRHGEQSGTPAQLDLDLTWTTDGVPYHYDLTTRYEIPCLVSGTVTIDGETFTVDGQGQRDHSWGVRDWWAFGWCWCSMRLDDGTRIHLADIRMGIGIPVFFGYVQTPGEVHPATALTVTEDAGRARLPVQGAHRDRRRTRPRPAAPTLGLDVTPVAFGPVLLRNDERPHQPVPPGHGALPDRRRARPARAGSSGTSPTLRSSRLTLRPDAVSTRLALRPRIHCLIGPRIINSSRRRQLHPRVTTVATRWQRRRRRDTTRPQYNVLRGGRNRNTRCRAVDPASRSGCGASRRLIARLVPVAALATMLATALAATTLWIGSTARPPRPPHPPPHPPPHQTPTRPPPRSRRAPPRPTNGSSRPSPPSRSSAASTSPARSPRARARSSSISS